MKKLKLKLLIIGTFLNAGSVIACLNGYGLSEIIGEYHYKSLATIRNIHFSNYQKQIEHNREQAGLHLNKDKTGYLIDIASLDIISGKYESAKNILHGLLKTKSIRYEDRYSATANLGVVHELMGNNDSAKYYVAEALKLNPRSHENSEWIHFKLLEAKEKDATWIYTNEIAAFQVIKINAEAGFSQILTANGTTTIDELIRQINWQLHERMLFVKPKDKLVANLLFTLGKLYYLKNDQQKAESTFALAKEYDPALTSECDRYKNAGVYVNLLYGDKLRSANQALKTANDDLTIAMEKKAHAARARAKSKKDYDEAIQIVEEKKTNQLAAAGCLISIIAIVWLAVRRYKKRKINS
jgi:tetratricopeptide (TPR) repeat protein